MDVATRQSTSCAARLDQRRGQCASRSRRPDHGTICSRQGLPQSIAAQRLLSCRRPGSPLVRVSRPGAGRAAIEGPVAAIASALAELHPNLRWYRSATGPFASVNFARDHAHALLVGPGGIEERDDVEVGLTVMGPFSRFPDHHRPHPSVFLAVSRAEVRVGDTDWTTCSPGEIFFVDEGSKIALRCTRDPLLLLWCQRIHRR
ncbi:dimethylsulfonioproprionate lyase family protein [Sinorhizobium fredii]|uniref:dimethylsulfonioproprionate lyase family protein n=1 Tax=Rhizobium fredii TaxID=380 RepID=UPI0009B69F5F